MMNKITENPTRYLIWHRVKDQVYFEICNHIEKKCVYQVSEQIHNRITEPVIYQNWANIWRHIRNNDLQ